ncbi:hypothetical protein CMI37_10515 [Candidatus Pacearchaeota archaeon]|jgi:hypothetical protein|nr:hypothetical protein [Candidatus Pacearchaeota archaeon]
MWYTQWVDKKEQEEVVKTFQDNPNLVRYLHWMDGMTQEEKDRMMQVIKENPRIQYTLNQLVTNREGFIHQHGAHNIANAEVALHASIVAEMQYGQ